MTDHSNTLSAELLDRYLAGECTPDEKATVEAWLAGHPDHERAIAIFRAMGSELGIGSGVPAGAEPSVEDAWARFEQRHASRATGSRKHGGVSFPFAERHSGTGRSPVWAMLVAALVIVATGVVWNRTHHGSPAMAVRQPPTVTEVATQRGHRDTVRLADGTVVILGAESRLRYDSDFGKAQREVKLDGQAFFDVVHDDGRPFRVRTTHGVAQDVGTKFAVTAYRESDGVSVVVIQGAVMLAPTRGVRADSAVSAGADSAAGSSTAEDARGILLHAADLARINGDGDVTMQHDVDVTAAIGWLQGRLAFDDTPLRDVVIQLNRYYDADVRLGDPDIGTLLVSTPRGTDSLNETITMMSAVLNLRVVRSGKTVTLYPNRN